VSEPWTHGPWTATDSHDAYEAYGPAIWRNMPNPGYPVDLIAAAHKDADARLIAAAPEMAALLAEAIAWQPERSWADFNRRAATVLARARGEA
jgi:hypothetical protein